MGLLIPPLEWNLSHSDAISSPAWVLRSESCHPGKFILYLIDWFRNAKNSGVGNSLEIDFPVNQKTQLIQIVSNFKGR